MIWFLLAAAGLLVVGWLMFARYVRKDQQAVRSGTGLFLFAACVLLFAVGALAAGFFSVAVGR